MDVYIRDRKTRLSVPIANYPCLVLERNDWNDYSYLTTFGLQLRASEAIEDQIELGGVKIMVHGQEKGSGSYPFSKVQTGLLPPELLIGNVCSLGISVEYYDRLANLPLDQAKEILLTLQDAAVYEDVRTKFESEPCFKISLLRDSKDIELLATAGKRFGAAENMIGKFTASIRLDGSSAPHKFDFNFEPHGGLPHRVSAVVGLNGVGKTQIMAKLAMSVSRFSKKSVKEKSSALDENNMLDPVPSIFNVVAVSFSAFDEFDRPTQKQGEDFNYSYCGLQTHRGRLKTKEDLLNEIKSLISQGMTDDKRKLLKQVLGSLVRVDDMESFIDNPEFNESLYERLSAGQRIALNCICHILSKISPRTLVLFDEPEVHLHPQFLTGMLHALSEILSKYDSFSIIATHSPLVVQQLPRRSVYVVRRDRMMPIILKPTFETFGESLAEITRFIFTATEADRDYKNVLDELMQSGKSASDVLQLFDGKLGLNALIYLQSLD